MQMAVEHFHYFMHEFLIGLLEKKNDERVLNTKSMAAGNYPSRARVTTLIIVF
jgi:hypothetical protein